MKQTVYIHKTKTGKSELSSQEVLDTVTEILGKKYIESQPKNYLSDIIKDLDNDIQKGFNGKQFYLKGGKHDGK